MRNKNRAEEQKRRSGNGGVNIGGTEEDTATKASANVRRRTKPTANQTNSESNGEPDQQRKQRRRCRDQVNSKRTREGEREPTVDEERGVGGAEEGDTAKAAAHNGEGPHTAARVKSGYHSEPEVKSG
ncbi:hypothetical protein U1Q18_042899 [Sarracenia purpurea var. burkii]